MEALAEAIIETQVEAHDETSGEDEVAPSTIAFAATTGAKTAPTAIDVGSGKTLPFVGSRGPSRSQDAPPIEGAPWSPLEVKPIRPAEGVQRTLSLEELRALDGGEVDAVLASRVEAAAEAPPPPKAPTPPEPRPAKWREDPEEKLPPREPPKPSPPPRKNLNAGLYSAGSKLRKR